MQTPAPFEYERATSVGHALALLERFGPEARLVAGGHSLLPMMKLRLADPEYLIDINDLTDLDYVRLAGDTIAIGAMTRHATLLASPVLAEHYPIFADAERVIADPVVRNRGTIGGSLCQGDPSEDLPAVASALSATLVIQGIDETRTVSARAFHTGPYETVVGPAEILTEVRIPIRPGAGSAYEKVERRAGDWGATAGGCFVVLAADGETVVDVGIGLTAVGAPHFCAEAAEAVLRGRPATAENLAAAAAAAAEVTNPQTDQRGPAEYKRHLAGELTRRALRRAVARARGQEA
ncbi:MAG TPA: xanthine dehydrogenase family protein subunit M [Acidimicrobiia bacterium]|nr:xanthine dehydrogenase family protein subunit M [Acidimicrobiia bacterium]